MEKLNLNPFGLSGQQYDPVAIAKMKADTINSTPGNLTGHDCPKCLNRGTIAFPRGWQHLHRRMRLYEDSALHLGNGKIWPKEHHPGKDI